MARLVHAALVAVAGCSVRAAWAVSAVWAGSAALVVSARATAAHAEPLGTVKGT